MKPKFPKVQTCCGCISLRTGAKIFGFLSLSCGLLLVMGGVLDAFAILDSGRETNGLMLTEAVIDVLIHSAHLVTSFLMLLGVYQEKKKLVLPWLVTTVLVAVAEFILMSSIFGQILKPFQAQYIEYFSIVILLSVVDLIDDIYGFIVVYSYYLTLPAQESRAV